jgi:hypothetical protein
LFSCDSTSTLKSPEESYFLKYFGNEGSQEGVDFVENTDGSFILLGNSTKPSGSRQIYIAKADAKGKVIWERTYGGLLDDEAKDIELLADGNLIVVGNTELTGISPNPNQRDVMILRISQDGVKLDSVLQGLTYAGAPNDDNANSISIISNGYIVAGSTSKNPLPTTSDVSDFMFMRFRADLSFVKDTDPEAWNSTPVNGFKGEDVAVKVVQLNANTFHLMGYTNADPTLNNGIADYNYYVAALSDKGIISSAAHFLGAAAPNDEKLTDVSITPAASGAGYLLSGSAQNATDGNVYLVKLTQQLTFTSSDISFQNTMALAPGKFLLQKSLNSSSPTNGYFVTSEQVDGSTTNIILSKRDNRGNEVFQKIFGGAGNDFAGPVKELPDGQIAMIGTMTLGGVVDGQRKIVFMKLNAQGRLAP